MRILCVEITVKNGMNIFNCEKIHGFIINMDIFNCKKVRGFIINFLC